jgi:hypothetical protein
MLLLGFLDYCDDHLYMAVVCWIYEQCCSLDQ